MQREDAAVSGAQGDEHLDGIAADIDDGDRSRGHAPTEHAEPTEGKVSFRASLPRVHHRVGGPTPDARREKGRRPWRPAWVAPQRRSEAAEPHDPEPSSTWRSVPAADAADD